MLLRSNNNISVTIIRSNNNDHKQDEADRPRSQRTSAKKPIDRTQLHGSQSIRYNQYRSIRADPSTTSVVTDRPRDWVRLHPVHSVTDLKKPIRLHPVHPVIAHEKTISR
jgi:hypothetical protein